MNFLDAAEQVLKKSNKPLHYKKITRGIITEKLVETSGKTPDATLNALLGTDIKVNAEKSRFMRTARGIFGLREWELEEYVPETKKEKEDVLQRAYWLVSTSERNFKHDRKVLDIK